VLTYPSDSELYWFLLRLFLNGRIQSFEDDQIYSQHGIGVDSFRDTLDDEPPPRMGQPIGPIPSLDPATPFRPRGRANNGTWYLWASLTGRPEAIVLTF
jgi:hypothetical protein